MTSRQGNANAVDPAADREMWTDIDRRAFARFMCGLAGIAKSLEQTRPQPVSVGDSFPVSLSDLSTGGAKLQTPHELGLGDTLEIIVDEPGGGTTPMRRVARVMWTGQTAQQQWSAGVEFIGESPAADSSSR
jgi:hypothetical protein